MDRDFGGESRRFETSRPTRPTFDNFKVFIFELSSFFLVLLFDFSVAIIGFDAVKKLLGSADERNEIRNFPTMQN